MSYQFLHHLTLAPLPVTIYDNTLLEQLCVYEAARLVVVVVARSAEDRSAFQRNPAQVMKVTAAGRRAVHRHLKTLGRSSCGIPADFELLDS